MGYCTGYPGFFPSTPIPTPPYVYPASVSLCIPIIDCRSRGVASRLLWVTEIVLTPVLKRRLDGLGPVQVCSLTPKWSGYSLR